jgi:hypothetical protein
MKKAFANFELRIAIAVLIAALALTACSPTIARKEVQQKQASFTSTGQDSGILDEKSTEPVFGFAVNQDWINGYDALLEKYGNTLSPARKKGDRDGVTKEWDHWRVSDAVMERQLVMNQRRVNEQAP